MSGELKKQIRDKIYYYHGNVGEATLDTILNEAKQEIYEILNFYGNFGAVPPKVWGVIFKWFGEEK